MKAISITLLTMLSFLGLRPSADALAIGDEAPRVTARNQDGAEVDLAEVYAKGPVLVYFYPKADTSGCTAQACSLRDAFPDFTSGGVEIIGVSGDSVEGQKAFAKKHNLPFTLLSDPDSAVAKAFGVPTLLGIPKRQSFIVSEGKIAWVVEKAKTGDHAAEVRAALEALQAPKNP
jgi:thioredoxin-dependent peroxiredoxin